MVTDIAGTTRDVLREHIHIDGMPLHIIDTAGLRDANDEVERIGIERAWQEIAQADRVLFMVDGTTTAPLTRRRSGQTLSSACPLNCRLPWCAIKPMSPAKRSVSAK
ncbi:50S ribosome-binding GTPase [Klebsiella pneumoniae]|nr:50S ribosome-binding GTPase [Klebsiella pneumoniae]